MLYIVDHLAYKSYLIKKPYNFIYKLYKPTFKPQILGPISESNEELGYIVGINLREINYRDDNLLRKYIENIKLLLNHKIKTLYIEDSHHMDLDRIKGIELETGLTIARGLTTKLENILPILEKIYGKRNESLENKEVLILCHDKDLARKTIRSIWDKLNFISLVNFHEPMMDVQEEIFEEIGISLYQPSIDKINLKTYDIIINLYDGHVPNTSQARGSSVIFDFSMNKPFLELDMHFVIGDLNFRIDNEKQGINDLIPHIIPSALYEELIGRKDESFYQIFANNNFHFLDNFISNFYIGIKGSF